MLLPSPMRQLFVWYRVHDDRADVARVAVQAMQRSLASASPGLNARLLIRRSAAGEQTWMETYARDATGRASSGIDASIESAIEAAASALVGLIDGERHVEAFDLMPLR